MFHFLLTNILISLRIYLFQFLYYKFIYFNFFIINLLNKNLTYLIIYIFQLTNKIYIISYLLIINNTN